MCRGQALEARLICLVLSCYPARRPALTSRSARCPVRCCRERQGERSPASGVASSGALQGDHE